VLFVLFVLSVAFVVLSGRKREPTIMVISKKRARLSLVNRRR